MNALTSSSNPAPLERPVRPAILAPGLLATIVTLTAVLSAVALRWFQLGALSLWFDEGQTEFAASLSPSNVIRLVQSADHPPLYFLLQHYWGLVFGNSEFALRSLPALFGTLSLPVFYLFAKKILDNSMAVALSMWLFAFSTMQIWYSREARAYEPASFLALVGFYALVLFLEKRSRALFAIVVLSATANLYMHNIMLFYLFALNVLWLTYPSERSLSQRLKELLLADVLAGVFYLPWVPSLLAQASVDITKHMFWAPRPTVGTFLGTVALLSGFNLEYLSWLPARVLRMSSGASSILVVGCVGLCCAAVLTGGLWRVAKLDRNKLLSLLLTALAPILAVFALSQVTTSLFIDRIFIGSSVIFPIILAYPLASQKARNWQRAYSCLGIVLAAAITLSGFGFLRYQEKDDWRSATNSLLRTPPQNRLIVFVARMGEPLFDYYAHRSRVALTGLKEVGLPRDPLAEFPPPPGGRIYPADLDQLKRAVESGSYKEVDLVLASELHDDPEELTLSYVSQACVRQDEQRFTGIRVLRFTPRADLRP